MCLGTMGGHGVLTAIRETWEGQVRGMQNSLYSWLSRAAASGKVDPVYETLRYGTSLALMNRSSFSSTSESPTRSLVWETPKGGGRGPRGSGAEPSPVSVPRASGMS